MGNAAYSGAWAPPTSLRKAASRTSAPSASQDGGAQAPWRNAPSPPRLMVSPASLRPQSVIKPPPAALRGARAELQLGAGPRLATGRPQHRGHDQRGQRTNDAPVQGVHGQSLGAPAALQAEIRSVSACGSGASGGMRRAPWAFSSDSSAESWGTPGMTY